MDKDYLNKLTEQQQIDFFFPEDDIDAFLFSIKEDCALLLDAAYVVNCYATCNCGRVYVPLEPFVNSFKNYYKDYERLYELKDFNFYCSLHNDMCGFCQNELSRKYIINQLQRI